MSKGGFMKDALILFAITLVAGACLGGAYEITKGPIEAAELAAKEEAFRTVLADADSFKLEDYDAALSALQSGLALEDTSLRQTLSFNQIVAYEKKGDFKQAAQLMSQYVKDYPDDTTAVREYEFLRSR